MSLAVRITLRRGVFGRRIAGAAFLLGALVGPASAQTAAPDNKFIGSQVCQACHPDVWLGFNRNPHFNQDFHFGPGTVKVYTRAAPKTTSFRAEPCTSPPAAGPKARPSAHRR